MTSPAAKRSARLTVYLSACQRVLNEIHPKNNGDER
jgi:hypothetical protein